jgi:antitoxin MazE
MPAVKIGKSRQVVIPRRIYDELGLASGDYLDVTTADGTIVLTPKELVDKRVVDSESRGRVAAR